MVLIAIKMSQWPTPISRQSCCRGMCNIATRRIITQNLYIQGHVRASPFFKNQIISSSVFLKINATNGAVQVSTLFHLLFVEAIENLLWCVQEENRPWCSSRGCFPIYGANIFTAPPRCSSAVCVMLGKDIVITLTSIPPRWAKPTAYICESK